MYGICRRLRTQSCAVGPCFAGQPPRCNGPILVPFRPSAHPFIRRTLSHPSVSVRPLTTCPKNLGPLVFFPSTSSRGRLSWLPWCWSGCSPLVICRSTDQRQLDTSALSSSWQPSTPPHPYQPCPEQWQPPSTTISIRRISRIWSRQMNVEDHDVGRDLATALSTTKTSSSKNPCPVKTTKIEWTATPTITRRQQQKRRNDATKARGRVQNRCE